MAISTVDSSYIQAAPGQLYLAAAPTTVTGADLAAKIETLFGLFYAAPVAARWTLTSDTPWAALTADGFKAKLKQVPIEFDPNDGPKYTVGYQELDATAEVTVGDVSAEKLAEMMSVSTSAIITTAAGAATAARKTIAAGGESTPTLYTLMYRYPSNKVANEFDHVLIPFCTFEVDSDTEYSKKSIRQAKLVIKARANVSLLKNASTGRPVLWIEDRATAVASSAPH